MAKTSMEWDLSIFMEEQFKVEYLQFHLGGMKTITAQFRKGQYINPEKQAHLYARTINQGETGRPPSVVNKEAKVYKRYITEWEEEQ